MTRLTTVGPLVAKSRQLLPPGFHLQTSHFLHKPSEGGKNWFGLFLFFFNRQVVRGKIDFVTGICCKKDRKNETLLNGDCEQFLLYLYIFNFYSRRSQFRVYFGGAKTISIYYIRSF